MFRSAYALTHLPFLAAALLAAACSSDNSEIGDSDDDPPVTPVGNNNVTLTSGGNNGSNGNGSGGGPYMLPPDYTATEFGGYKLGEPMDGETSGAGADETQGKGCSTTGRPGAPLFGAFVLLGLVRRRR